MTNFDYWNINLVIMNKNILIIKTLIITLLVGVIFLIYQSTRGIDIVPKYNKELYQENRANLINEKQIVNLKKKCVKSSISSL